MPGVDCETWIARHVCPKWRTARTEKHWRAIIELAVDGMLRANITDELEGLMTVANLAEERMEMA